MLMRVYRQNISNAVWQGKILLVDWPLSVGKSSTVESTKEKKQYHDVYKNRTA